MYIKPDKKYEKYFDRLLKDRVVYTKDIKFVRGIGRSHPELFDPDKGFMDIALIYKRRTSMMVLRPYAGIAPIYTSRDKKRYKFFKIF